MYRTLEVEVWKRKFLCDSIDSNVKCVTNFSKVS